MRSASDRSPRGSPRARRGPSMRASGSGSVSGALLATPHSMAATRVPKPASLILLIFRTVLLLCFYPTAIYDCIANGGCGVGCRCPAVLSHPGGSIRVRYACTWCALLVVLPFMYAADAGSNVAQASTCPACFSSHRARFIWFGGAHGVPFVCCCCGRFHGCAADTTWTQALTLAGPCPRSLGRRPPSYGALPHPASGRQLHSSRCHETALLYVLPEREHERTGFNQCVMETLRVMVTL
jgi:hypothetical protein